MNPWSKKRAKRSALEGLTLDEKGRFMRDFMMVASCSTLLDLRANLVACKALTPEVKGIIRNMFQAMCEDVDVQRERARIVTQILQNGGMVWVEDDDGMARFPSGVVTPEELKELEEIKRKNERQN